MVDDNSVTSDKPTKSIDRQMKFLYASTFLLRIGFAASLILFDWTLVFTIEENLGPAAASEFGPIFLTAFASITFLIAEVMMTGYYGHRSDSTGAKPILIFATFGAGVALVMYAPSTLFMHISESAWVSVFFVVAYLSVIHFIHGVFASAIVSPTLGFINHFSDDTNRSLRMAYYDNAILYGRAVGMPIGGLLWLAFGVDEKGISLKEQSRRIAYTYPILGLILAVAGILIVIGIENTPVRKEIKPFSLKKDITVAAKVMLAPKRRPLLMPWLALSAMIGSVSLWGPSIAFRAGEGEERSLQALVPIFVIVVALAIPAPFWGHYADTHNKKTVLKFGVAGLPVLGLGAAVFTVMDLGDFALSNPAFLFSIVPGIMLFSALVPVLMSALGDTAEKGVHDDGEVMSGYHFIIAMGEIIGILVGGILIALFALLEEATGIFGGQSKALLGGFLLFELVLLVSVIVGILRIPDDKTMEKPDKE